MIDNFVEEENTTDKDSIQEVTDFFGEDIVEIKDKGRRINMARGGFPGGMGNMEI